VTARGQHGHMVDVAPEAVPERGGRASLDCFGFHHCRPCRCTSESEDVADADAAPKYVFEDLGVFSESGTDRNAELDKDFSPDQMPAYASHGSCASNGSKYGSNGSRGSRRPASNGPNLLGSNGSSGAHRQAVVDNAKLEERWTSEDSHRKRGPNYASNFASNQTEATNYFTSGGDIDVLDEYDYYNPITRRKKVLSFSDNRDGVFHQRTGKIWNIFQRLRRDTKSPTPSEGSSQSDSDSESCHSDSLVSPTSVDLSPTSGRSVLRKQKTIFDEDNVTNWGILMGRLLHRRVHGIHGSVLKAIHRRKNSITGNEGITAIASHYVLPDVRSRAQMVLSRTIELAKALSQEKDDVFDHEWNVKEDEEKELITMLFGLDSADTLMLLANTVRKVIAAQPVLVEARAPCRVFGDIHGQFRDLLLIFRAYEMPGDNMSDFVFNGDFVDRGKHQIAVIGLLFALKILMPGKVWLVRGNHEDRAMNARYGFQMECKRILGTGLGLKTFDLIQRAFDYLPLGCVIAERVLVVHGGLGNGRWSLHDVRDVERPLSDKKLWSDSMVWNILWSDPIEDDVADQKATFGVHESPRGRGAQEIFKFGWNVTKTFCAANGLGLIVRSHQSKAGSLGFSVMHDKMLVRVFSARDYEEHGNDGAVILITPDDLKPRRLNVRVQVIGSLTKAKGRSSVERKKRRRDTSAIKPGPLERSVPRM